MQIEARRLLADAHNIDRASLGIVWDTGRRRSARARMDDGLFLYCLLTFFFVCGICLFVVPFTFCFADSTACCNFSFKFSLQGGRVDIVGIRRIGDTYFSESARLSLPQRCDTTRRYTRLEDNETGDNTASAGVPGHNYLNGVTREDIWCDTRLEDNETGHNTATAGVPGHN